MAKVYKYDVPMAEVVTLELPEGARVLTVKMQGDHPKLWALVDPSQRLVTREFLLVGTGQEIAHPDTDAEALPYLGSFQPGHGLIFHLFELVDPL